MVDNGSTDGTQDWCGSSARADPRIRLLQHPARTGHRARRAERAGAERGASRRSTQPTRRISSLNLDADVWLPPDYVERLRRGFRRRGPRLGIAGGSCYEMTDGRWRQRHVTGDTVWGAARAFRWTCLQDVGPVEERLSWDSLSQLQANALGWRTRTLLDLPFQHHRPEGGARRRPLRRARLNEGRVGLLHVVPALVPEPARASMHLARGDLGAPALLVGYGRAALRRDPRSPDPLIREFVRRNQSPARVPRRAAEALRRSRSAAATPPAAHPGPNPDLRAVDPPAVQCLPARVGVVRHHPKGHHGGVMGTLIDEIGNKSAPVVERRPLGPPTCCSSARAAATCSSSWRCARPGRTSRARG